MKKISFVLVIIIAIMGLAVFNKAFAKENVDPKKIADKLIRFHVIANSDSVEDQNLKLKVRDEILKYITPKLKNIQDIEASREILKNNEKQIGKIAEKIIKDNKFQYAVKVELSHENFPVKSYGNITLPQGEYEAFRVIIGKGEGKNWWCVMFPPLCFIDITKGEVANAQTEKAMKTVLSEVEYESIDNTKNKNIQVEFKIINILKDMFK